MKKERKFIIINKSSHGTTSACLIKQSIENANNIASPDGKTSEGEFIDFKTKRDSLKPDYEKILVSLTNNDLDPEVTLVEKQNTNPYNRQGNKVFIKKR